MSSSFLYVAFSHLLQILITEIILVTIVLPSKLDQRNYNKMSSFVAKYYIAIIVFQIIKFFPSIPQESSNLFYDYNRSLIKRPLNGIFFD